MLLEELENGSFVDKRDPGELTTGEKRVSVAPEESRFLAWVARARNVLEIGTGLGVSTRALHKHCRSLTTIDIDPYVHDHVWPKLPLEVWKVKDRAKVPLEKFDVVFVDGDHRTEQVRRDAEFAIARCQGVVIFHDAFMPSVQEGLAGFADWQVLDTTWGLAICWVWR